MAINDDIIIGIVFLIILFFLERKEADVKFYKNLEIKDLTVPATIFIKAILVELERKYPCRKAYSFEIKYYNTKSVMGKYFFNNNNMVIYLTRNNKLLEITDTVIHEYCHHLQNHSKKQDINFALKLYEREYENHPWEVEAREFASCLSLKILKKIIK
jgi:Zn-dependent peptidase ImmA (M78 family)